MTAGSIQYFSTYVAFHRQSFTVERRRLLSTNMEEESARIRIRRNTQPWFGLIRRLWVRIDGKKVYGLKHGELATLTVTPGEHIVQVQMDWCRTTPFPVACLTGETIDLECGPGPFWSIFPGMVLWPRRVFYVRNSGL